MQYLACIWTHWDWKNQDRSQLSETVFIGYECSLSNKVFLGLYSEWSWKGGQIGVIQSWWLEVVENIMHSRPHLSAFPSAGTSSMRHQCCKIMNSKSLLYKYQSTWPVVVNPHQWPDVIQMWDCVRLCVNVNLLHAKYIQGLGHTKLNRMMINHVCIERKYAKNKCTVHDCFAGGWGHILFPQRETAWFNKIWKLWWKK